MQVKIKRIDTDLPLPEYKTSGSVACDLYCRVEVKVAPRSLAKVPANVIIDCPPELMFIVAARSSMPSKKGLLIPNGIGVGDQDFCGPEDEWNVIVYNFTDEEVMVERGERIAQVFFLPHTPIEWVEVESMDHNLTRGGIGSTGRK